MTIRITVEGEVQGVGFRWFVVRTAERHGVKGRVWNGEDGAVELVAHHPDATYLAAFEQELWTGPGVVTGISSIDELDKPMQDGFHIVSRLEA